LTEITSNEQYDKVLADYAACQSLAAAVLLQTIRDYRHLKRRKIAGFNANGDAPVSLINIEKFLSSRLFKLYCDILSINPKAFTEKLVG
jgi:hypothetical protein